MGHSRPLVLLITALAVAAAGSSPARGQCRLCATPVTSVGGDANSRSISLEVETRIDFDRVIVAGIGEASATLRPDGSAYAPLGIVVSPRARVGTIVVHGEPGRAVRVDLPSRILLSSAEGGEILFEDVVSDLPGTPRLDSAGRLSFRIGGKLHVRGDADGQFRGDLPITVEYL